MPTSEEISQVQPLIAELMSAHENEYKANRKTANEVGDVALGLVNDAQSEAEKYVLLKGALHYYSLAKDFDKAANAIEAIQSQIKDVSASEVESLASKVLARARKGEAQRLRTILQRASEQSKTTEDIKALKAELRKNPGNEAAIRGLADAYVRFGDWPKALKEFATLGIEAAIYERNPADAKDFNALKAADYWWGFSEKNPEPYRIHAAAFYRKAIEEGLANGLVKTLAEKRIAEATKGTDVQPVPATQDAIASAERIPPAVSPPATTVPENGLIHRWSFSGNLKDSVGSHDGKTVGGKVTFETGQVRIRPDGGYVDLGANVLPGGRDADYTFEIWATKRSIRNWARVFQIPDSWGLNDYYWSWNHGKNPKKWQLKTAGCRGSDIVHGNGTGTGIENHFVIVYGHDENKKPYYHLYLLRGEKMYWQRRQGLLGDMFTSHSAFWLGHGSGAQADASYNEVRIWNRALTLEEIMRSAKLGPSILP